MDSINGIIQTAVWILGSIAALVGTGVGLYFYYTASGQEEGE